MPYKLEEIEYYQMSLTLFNHCWVDTEVLFKDFRGKELAKQLIRSVDSISSNIEEGYGRGMRKEYPHFLKIARGSAQESRGRYKRCQFLLPEHTISERVDLLGIIIAKLTRAIESLESKIKK